MLIMAAAFVFSATSALAELNLKTDKAVYNFGDEVVVSYDFSKDQDFSGLVKLSLSCTSFELDFYTLPTNLFAGQKQEVTVPPLSISPAMVGKCVVSANATSYDKLVNESSSSGSFNVTNLVSVAVKTDKDTYLPAESVEASGLVGKSHTLPASVVMTFLGTNYIAAVANNDFAYSIKLPRNIKSGNHSLEFFVNDSYGNSGSASATFKVEAVPTRIVNILSSQNVKPKEPFSVSVFVYDQADDVLESDLNIAVTDASGVVAITASNMTGVNITLTFPEGQKPGTYTLTSSALGLSAKSQLLVEPVEDVSVSFYNKTVILKNTGNINYAKKFNITLSGEKSYVVVHDVELTPGEAFEVDLTNTVSEGTYTVDFPTVSTAAPVEDVYLEDERPLIKKTSDFLGVTGRAVKLTGTGAGKIQASMAPVLLLVIVALLAFYFVRNKRKGVFGKGSSGMGERFDTSGSSNGGSGSGSEGSEAREAREAREAQKQQQKQPDEAAVEARIRQIIEEKRRQQLTREPQKPASLRENPEAQKFVKDILKDKPFR